LNEVANNGQLAGHVQTLIIGDERLDHRQYSPSNFIAYLEEKHCAKYKESPTSGYKRYNEALCIHRGYEVTIEELQDYPSTLTEIGIDCHQALELYRETGCQVFRHENLLADQQDTDYLSKAIEKFHSLTKVRLTLKDH
jgi:hypothetical protein